MKKPLIIIAGPTAVGKTRAGVLLSRKIGGEVISADSMQVYRGMDIGSAKVREEEKMGVPHHLIDIVSPTDEWNVCLFKKAADEKVREIYARGHVPVLVGGTGFYIQAVLYDIDFTENDADKTVRRELERLYAKDGREALLKILKEVDPRAYETMDLYNVKRVIRAIEFFRQTGIPISQHNEEERAKKSPYDFEYYVLTRERQSLYERIDRRVDRMMEDGLLEEVRSLISQGVTREMTSMQGLGYRQLYDYLCGEGTLTEAVERIKLETRHFSKRQLTWFRREKGARFIDVDKENFEDVFADGHLAGSLKTR